MTRAYECEFRATGTIYERWMLSVPDEVPDEAVDEEYVYEHITEGVFIDQRTDNEFDRTLLSHREVGA